ncbi:hypothetical protein VFPPC_15486 [Pochonia chlamydosporia 170]|uniref:Secreted protein n=1 Tax=Pochonia chlamydosporia 170 TaxID=1380566 RepID=A0A179FXF6_METCM|nr:hypothetical protein VFPPC_15486 [Pochonia chlamydosporia 170]OAQ69791.1 hypothetical protein VFPPC_15486 [Pochonia chlamydosporia 170]
MLGMIGGTFLCPWSSCRAAEGWWLGFWRGWQCKALFPCSTGTTVRWLGFSGEIDSLGFVHRCLDGFWSPVVWTGIVEAMLCSVRHIEEVRREACSHKPQLCRRSGFLRQA